MQDNPYGIEALWLQGDMVIKTVAIILLVMSILSWSIILFRAYRLWQLRRCQQRTNIFWQAPAFNEGLLQLYSNDLSNPFRRIAEEAKSASEHHQQYHDKLQPSMPISEWLNISLRSAIDESSDGLQRGLSVLASVGSTAPFIGLFGTVWGIYHALVNISASGQASIDKIAGPVGEALIMTALGLAVAIPAVLGYNALLRGNKWILGKLNRFAQQLHIYFLTGTPPIQQPVTKLYSVNSKTSSESNV